MSNNQVSINQKKLNLFFIGLSLFATYFGAGNLVFPPIIGLQSGTEMLSGILGLSISAIFLPIFGIVLIGFKGSVTAITDHVGKKFYYMIVGTMMVCATFMSIPRTGAVAVELGVQGNFENAPYIPILIGYFIIVFLCVYNKTKALDIVGKILTPVMAIILIILTVIAIINPLGNPTSPSVEHVFSNAFVNGYQTGDVTVSFMVATIFLSSISEKGFVQDNERKRAMLTAGVIAFISLFVIYSGLFYMGACVSGEFPPDIGRSELLSACIRLCGGSNAMLAFGVVVILACLTTAVSLITASADFFDSVFKGKIDYRIILSVIIVIAILTATLGVDGIVTTTGWLFNVFYAALFPMIILGTFQKFVPNDGAWKGAVWFPMVYAFLESAPFLNTTAPVKALISVMPLSKYGFGWILPCIIGFVIGLIMYYPVEKAKKQKKMSKNRQFQT